MTVSVGFNFAFVRSRTNFDSVLLKVGEDDDDRYHRIKFVCSTDIYSNTSLTLHCQAAVSRGLILMWTRFEGYGDEPRYLLVSVQTAPGFDLLTPGANVDRLADS